MASDSEYAEATELLGKAWSERDKLRKENAQLTAENERLRAENKRADKDRIVLMNERNQAEVERDKYEEKFFALELSLQHSRDILSLKQNRIRALEAVRDAAEGVKVYNSLTTAQRDLALVKLRDALEASAPQPEKLPQQAELITDHELVLASRLADAREESARLATRIVGLEKAARRLLDVLDRHAPASFGDAEDELRDALESE